MLIRITFVLLIPSIVVGLIPSTFEISPYGFVEYPCTIEGFDGRTFEQTLRANTISASWGTELGIYESLCTGELSFLSEANIDDLLSLARREYADEIPIDEIYFLESSLWMSIRLAARFSISENIIIPVRFNMDFGSPMYSIRYKSEDETVDVLDGYTYHRAISLSAGIKLSGFDILTLELGQRGTLDLFEGDHALPAYAELTLFDTGDWFGGVKLYGEYDWLDNWTKFKATASLVIRLLPLESE